MKSITKIHCVVFYWLMISLLVLGMRSASAAGPALQLRFRDNRLSISANDADIRTVLQRVSEETGILIQFPKALKKNISLTLSKVKIESALKKLLKGLNYATVYAVSNKKNKIQVSKVYIFKSYKGAARSRRLTGVESQRQKRISLYKKRIATIQKRLNEVPPDSPAGRRLNRQLQNYQKAIDRLE